MLTTHRAWWLLLTLQLLIDVAELMIVILSSKQINERKHIAVSALISGSLLYDLGSFF